MNPLEQMLERPRRADALVAAWVILWVGMGIWTAVTVHGLKQVADTSIQAGDAVGQAGQVLSLLGAVPVVGGQLAAQADQIRTLGDSARKSGEESKSSIDRLTFLLGFSIAIVPSVPLLVFYIPARLAARRPEDGPSPRAP
ncbi:MAG: hypothetical protein ACJ76V_09395 [Thermoleophilaceae bacterium]